MKLFIYCARDKKLGAYQVPEYKTEDPEHISEGTARSLAVVQGETIEKARLKDQALYFMGYFDDVKGKFELLEEPQKLIDYEDYLPRKESVSDGKGSEA